VDYLQSSLLDLLHELRDVDFPLIVGGGFGLFLKRLHLESTGSRTLLTQLPQPRATNDLDLFIRVELLADHATMLVMSTALRRLGYQAVPEAKFLQWKRTIDAAGIPHEVKIDFLVGPLGDRRSNLHVKQPRVRPKKPIELHAYSVEEAIDLEEDPVSISVQGNRSTGEPFQDTVYVPHPFPYLLMKLSAFSDRQNDADRQLGRHHALDVYTLVGLLTESEYECVREKAAQHADSPYLARTRQIVERDFSHETAIGILRLKEHALFQPEFQVAEMRAALQDIFGIRP
jgi:hypothetical protein